MTRGIPEQFHSITPMVMFKDARSAIDFYVRAFGAQELFTMPGPDGKGVMHAQVRVGDSIIMMGEENPQHACKSAESAGDSPVSFYFYVENVDEAFRRAVAAGAKAEMPVEDMFWGDRVGSVRDPFNYVWTIATHARDLTRAEIAEGARAAFARAARK